MNHGLFGRLKASNHRTAASTGLNCKRGFESRSRQPCNPVISLTPAPDQPPGHDNYHGDDYGNSYETGSGVAAPAATLL